MSSQTSPVPILRRLGSPGQEIQTRKPESGAGGSRRHLLRYHASEREVDMQRVKQQWTTAKVNAEKVSPNARSDARKNL